MMFVLLFLFPPFLFLRFLLHPLRRGNARQTFRFPSILFRSLFLKPGRCSCNRAHINPATSILILLDIHLLTVCVSSFIYYV